MNPEQVKVQALQQRREGLAFDLWGFEQVCGYAALAGVIGGIATMKRLREYPVSAPAAITATELPEVTHSVSVAATASRAAAVATAEDLRNVTFLPGAVAQPA